MKNSPPTPQPQPRPTSLCLPLAIAICSCCCCACSRSETFKVPNPTHIFSVQISNNGSPQTTRSITDPKTIQRLSELLQHNQTATAPISTFPTPQTTAQLLNANKQSELTLFLGPDWIGTPLPSSGNGFLDANPTDASEIRKILTMPSPN